MPPALPAVNPMNPHAGIYGSGTKVSDSEWKLARSYPRISDALPDVHSNEMLSIRESGCTMVPSCHWALPKQLYSFYRLSLCISEN